MRRSSVNTSAGLSAKPSSTPVPVSVSIPVSVPVPMSKAASAGSDPIDQWLNGFDEEATGDELNRRARRRCRRTWPGSGDTAGTRAGEDAKVPPASEGANHAHRVGGWWPSAPAGLAPDLPRTHAAVHPPMVAEARYRGAVNDRPPGRGIAGRLCGIFPRMWDQSVPWSQLSRRHVLSCSPPALRLPRGKALPPDAAAGGNRRGAPGSEPSGKRFPGSFVAAYLPARRVHPTRSCRADAHRARPPDLIVGVLALTRHELMRAKISAAARHRARRSNRHPHGRESVRHEGGCRRAARRGRSARTARVGLGVEARGRFIEHQQGGRSHEPAREATFCHCPNDIPRRRAIWPSCVLRRPAGADDVAGAGAIDPDRDGRLVVHARHVTHADAARNQLKRKKSWNAPELPAIRQPVSGRAAPRPPESFPTGVRTSSPAT